jgi:hypothetical protein
VSGPTRVANFPWTTPPDLSSLPTPGPHESPEFMEALAAGRVVSVHLDEPATGVGRPSPLAGLSKLDDALARLHDLDPTGAEDDDYADAIATADGLRAVIDRLVDEWRPE